ncbi:MAG: efflux RND transporter permease subunit [Candidatus Bipolaricaulota bacterium]|nr:efflux RND transporter permease subunit [Candidatus Bipolaricaulota bacterium]
MRRLFTWIVDHAGWVVGAVGLLTVALVIPLFSLKTNVDFASYMNSKDPAYILMKNAEDRYGSQTLLMVAVIAPDDIFNATTLAKIEQLETRLAEIPGVEEVQGPLGQDVITSSETALDVGPAAPDGRAPTTPEGIAAYRERILGMQSIRGLLIAEDGSAAAILIRMERHASDYDVTKAVREVVNEVGTPPERFSISGEPYMMLSLTESIQRDLVILIPIILVVMCLVLFLTSRTVRGVWIPLLVVGLSVVWTFGPMGLLGIEVSIITFILPVLLLAIGIAYGIHIMHRYDEEIALGKSRREAVIESATAISGAVVMAGLTTVGGFLSLLTCYMPLFREFGIIAAIGVALALVLALLVVPALLAILPAPKLRLKARAEAGTNGRLARGLGTVVGGVARRPRSFLVAMLIVVAGLAMAVPLLKTDSSMAAFLGEEHPAILGMTDFDRHFSGSEQLMIEIDTGQRDGLKDPKVLREMLDLEAYLRTLGVRKTSSITDVVRELNLRIHANDPAFYAIPTERKQVSQLLALFSSQGGDFGTVALPNFSAGEIAGYYPRADGATKAKLVRDIRAYLREHFTGDAKAEMVGPTQFFDSMSRQLIRSLISNIYSSAIIVWLIVTAIMGSVVAGLICLIPLAFTLLVVFAVMALSGSTLNIASATIAGITMGTGIDYAIHFVSRYRTEMAVDGDCVRSAERTARSAGRAILFNAAAVGAGFLVLCVSKFMAFRSFGGLLGLAMAASGMAALTIVPAVLVTLRPRFVTTPPWSRLRRFWESRTKKT